MTQRQGGAGGACSQLDKEHLTPSRKRRPEGKLFGVASQPLGSAATWSAEKAPSPALRARAIS